VANTYNIYHWFHPCLHVRSRYLAASTAKVESSLDRRVGGEVAARALIFARSCQVCFCTTLPFRPVPTQNTSLSALPEFIYRKVLLRGKWDHSRAMLLGPRVYEGKSGFHLVTPLVRTDGSTILVNRGFISNDFTERSVRPEHDGEVELIGVLRTSHIRNNFTPDNHPEEGKWYWADIDAMSVYAGGEKADVQPVYVEEVFGKSEAFPRVI
jgi:cytochrome oxidase assembly protein ShyY1